MTDRLAFLKWVRNTQIETSCLKTHRIWNYEPGCGYVTFGNYPTRRPYYPGDDAWAVLDFYAENGVGTVLAFAQWADICGFFGKGPMDPINPGGFRRFIDECHRRGLKIVPYVSPGYLDVRNPAWHAEWSRGVGHLYEIYIDLDMMCPGSPGWRDCFFRAIDRIMDDYGCDGLYWDGGLGLGKAGCVNPDNDNHVHFEDLSADQITEFTPEQKGNVDHLDDAVKTRISRGLAELWNDFLCRIYARVKRRNGFVIAHIGSDIESPFKDKCWDYQLIGEGVPDMSISIDKTKNYQPYIIRFNDFSRLVTRWQDRDFTPDLDRVPKIARLGMCAIPYLQFPWFHHKLGDPNEDVRSVPGVVWKKEYDVWTEWDKALKRIGPSTIDDMVNDIYAEHLHTYKQMTRPNTMVYIEVEPTGDAPFPLTEGKRRVSVFVNDSLWVAIGNMEQTSQQTHARPLTGTGNDTTFTLDAGSLTVLRYRDLTCPPEVIQH